MNQIIMDLETNIFGLEQLVRVRMMQIFLLVVSGIAVYCVGC